MAKPKGHKQVEKLTNEMEHLETLYVEVGKVHPNEYNSNRMDEYHFEMLLKSMNEDGFTTPSVCIAHPHIEGEYKIVDGEHRWRVAQEIDRRAAENIAAQQEGKDRAQWPFPDIPAKLRHQKIPIAVTPMTPQQAMVATLRHNRARGSEDVELSASILRELRSLGALDHAVDSLQIDDVELDLMLNDVLAPEALAGAEYNQGWEPEQGSATASVLETGATENVVSQQANYLAVEGMTQAAIEASRARQEALKVATTEEEKKKIQRDGSVTRLACMFTGDEGKIVTSVLGTKAPQTLLAICQIIYRESNGEPQLHPILRAAAALMPESAPKLSPLPIAEATQATIAPETAPVTA